MAVGCASVLGREYWCLSNALFSLRDHLFEVSKAHLCSFGLCFARGAETAPALDNMSNNEVIGPRTGVYLWLCSCDRIATKV